MQHLHVSIGGAKRTAAILAQSSKTNTQGSVSELQLPAELGWSECRATNAWLQIIQFVETGGIVFQIRQRLGNGVTPVYIILVAILSSDDYIDRNVTWAKFLDRL